MIRDGRKREVRARTEDVARLPKRVLQLITEYPDVDRPRTRGDCENGTRPCPFISCKWHLYLDVSDNGNIKFNFPDLEPDELAESCVLDVADRGPSTLERAGELMNVTRERIRQLETKASARMQKRAVLFGISADLVEDRPPSAWDDLRSEHGGGGGGVPDETASSEFGRGAELDEEAVFCERVYRAYERELRQGVPEMPARVEAPPPVDPAPEELELDEDLGPETPRLALNPEPSRLDDALRAPATEKTMTNEEKMLAALREWWAGHDVAPTAAQLLKLTGMKSTNLVSATLSKMRAKGLLNGMKVTVAGAKAIAPNAFAPPAAAPEPPPVVEMLPTPALVDMPWPQVDVEQLIEERALYHEKEAELRQHHELVARRLRAALAAMRGENSTERRANGAHAERREAF